MFLLCVRSWTSVVLLWFSFLMTFQYRLCLLGRQKVCSYLAFVRTSVLASVKVCHVLYLSNGITNMINYMPLLSSRLRMLVMFKNIIWSTIRTSNLIFWLSDLVPDHAGFKYFRCTKLSMFTYDVIQYHNICQRELQWMERRFLQHHNLLLTFQAFLPVLSPCKDLRTYLFALDS